MLARYLMIFAVLFAFGACSKKDETAMDAQAGMEEQSMMGQEGPMGEGYETSTTTTPGSAQDFVVNVGDRVFFGYDRYDLSAEAQDSLNRQADWLQQYPNLSVTVEGHCDERGTREYNLALGERRANSVKNYLAARGVDAGRITTISYGKERPAVPGSDEASWAQNRRGVTVIE